MARGLPVEDATEGIIVLFPNAFVQEEETEAALILFAFK
jgi:hypothetical protein